MWILFLPRDIKENVGVHFFIETPCIYWLFCHSVVSAIKIPRDKLFACMNAIGMVVTALPVTTSTLLAVSYYDSHSTCPIYSLLGCIECMQWMRCCLLLLMCMVSVHMSASLSVSCGSTRLRCAKMAQRIKMLFDVNTLGCPWEVLHGGPYLPTDRRRGPF